jgi:hypothetical protein
LTSSDAAPATSAVKILTGMTACPCTGSVLSGSASETGGNGRYEEKRDPVRIALLQC